MFSPVLRRADSHFRSPNSPCLRVLITRWLHHLLISYQMCSLALSTASAINRTSSLRSTMARGMTAHKDVVGEFTFEVGLHCLTAWLQNGDVLCFLWGRNWIYICYVEESRRASVVLRSEFLLQIQRSGFGSRRYQILCGTGSAQPREYNGGATWKKK
jgi:hypothetical protein